MPWFDKAIHPVLRKAEDRSRIKEERGPATPEDMAKLARQQRVAGTRDTIVQGAKGIGRALDVTTDTIIPAVGSAVSGLGSAVRGAVKDTLTNPEVQETSREALEELGRLAGPTVQRVETYANQTRKTRGQVTGIGAARRGVDALADASSSAKPSAASDPSAPDVAPGPPVPAAPPSRFQQWLSGLRQTLNRPRQSASAMRQQREATRQAPAQTGTVGVPETGTPAKPAEQPILIEALADLLAGRDSRLDLRRHDIGRRVAQGVAIGKQNVTQLLTDPVGAITQTVTGGANQGLKDALGPEAEVIEREIEEVVHAAEGIAGFADIYEKHPQYLNQHTNLEVLDNKDQHGARFVRNPLTGRMGKIVEITHPEQEHIGPVIEGMFHGGILPRDEEYEEYDDYDQEEGGRERAQGRVFPAGVSPQPRKARFVLSWLDGHPSNDWIHPDIAAHIRNPSEAPSPFGPMPRRQWSPDAIREGGKSGLQEHNQTLIDLQTAEDTAKDIVSARYEDPDPDQRYQTLGMLQHQAQEEAEYRRKRKKLTGPASPEEIEQVRKELYDREVLDQKREIANKIIWDRSRQEAPEFVEPSEEQRKHAAGPMGWTMPGISMMAHDVDIEGEDPTQIEPLRNFAGRLFSAPHSPEERARYLAENIEAMKRGSVVLDPRQQRSTLDQKGATRDHLTPIVGDRRKDPMYTRSHAVLSWDQARLLSDPDVARWHSARDLSLTPAVRKSSAFRAKRWADLVDLVGHEYPAPEGVNQEDWEKALKIFPRTNSPDNSGRIFLGLNEDDDGFQSDGNGFLTQYGDPEADPNGLERQAARIKQHMYDRIRNFDRSYKDVGGRAAEEREGARQTAELITSLSAMHDASTEDQAKDHMESHDALFQSTNGRQHSLAKDDASASAHHRNLSLDLRRRGEGGINDNYHGRWRSSPRPKRIGVRQMPPQLYEINDGPDELYWHLGTELEPHLRTEANELWPYPDDYLARDWEHHYVGNFETGSSWHQPEVARKEEEAITQALKSIPGQNFDDKDVKLLRAAIHSPHFDGGDSTLGEDAHRNAFAAGLQRAREHHEATEAGADPTRPFAHSAEEYRLSSNDLGVSLVRSAPELLAKRIKVLRARVAEMERHNGYKIPRHPDDPSDDYAELHIEIAKRELQSTAELLEKFKWNPLVAGHARDKSLWWETHPESVPPNLPEQNPSDEMLPPPQMKKSFFHLTRTSSLHFSRNNWQ